MVYCCVSHCIAAHITGSWIPTNWLCLFHAICIILYHPVRMSISFFLSFYNNDCDGRSSLPSPISSLYRTADGWILALVPKITGWRRIVDLFFPLILLPSSLWRIKVLSLMTHNLFPGWNFYITSPFISFDSSFSFSFPISLLFCPLRPPF